MLNFQKTFHDKNIYVKPLQKEDYQKLKPLTRDSEMWVYFRFDLSNLQTLQTWVNHAIKDLHQQKALPLIIINSENHEVVGCTRIGNIAETDQRVEIGWTWISKKYQGTGVNLIVKKMLINYLFNQTATLRIEFKTDVLNLPARKSLEKLGMIQEGVLRSHTLMTHNRRRDTVYYSILREEWLKIKNSIYEISHL